MTYTTATLFSGFEGVGIGAINAGLTHLWGVEFDADIAAVAETNGFKTIVADVRAVDYATLERPWHLHASPVCKNASTAKTNGEESTDDLETAVAVERAIEALRPTLFTLENVRGYLHFTAFKNIMRTLRRLGYQIAHDVLNAANFGVPQTRERLIVVARNDGKRPRMPEPTHEMPELIGGWWDDRKPWELWSVAICGLEDTLPKAELSEWQIKWVTSCPVFIIDSKNTRNFGHGPTIRTLDPMFTVTSAMASHMPKISINGHICKATPRCLARFQSFPDSYKLPESARLATTGIGNAAPPLLMQRVLEANL